MPEWAQQIAAVLPFKWAFGYPIEVILGRYSPEQVLFGFAMQAFWVLLGLTVIGVVWPAAVRRYSAVGN
jgi:ABC-2 type transport system permease protein